MVLTQADLYGRGALTRAQLGENTCPHCGDALWADDDREDANIIDCECDNTYTREEAVWVPDYPDCD